MRSFLPIKGPGGRYLTTREKVALLILGLTLVLFALTLLAGDDAYVDEPGRNPVWAFVAALCRTFGGGVVALYGIVLVWSGLIYFKGEKVADVAPLGGRVFAAVAVAIGLSGALGIGQLDSAGRLGLVVGGALYNTFGDVIGFVFMFGLMGFGLNLAGQGAWTALREPMPAAGGAAPAKAAGFGFGIQAPPDRQTAPPMPDDGDPSADERSMAVTQAMEEIERSKGVTIVEMDEEEEPEGRSSIGEEVDEAPPPPPDTEEAEVQRGVETIVESLDEDEDLYEHAAHGFVPVPSEVDEVEEEDEEYEDDPETEADHYEEEEYETSGDDAVAEDDADEEEYEEAEADDEAEYEYEEAEADEECEEAEADDEEYEYEEAEADDEEYEHEEAEADDEEYEYEEAEDDGETEEAEAEDEYAEEAEDEEAEEYEYEEAEAEDDRDEEDAEDDEPAALEEEAPAPIAAAAAVDEGSREMGVPQADGCGEDQEDPYAQGGLVRRLQEDPAPPVQPDDEDPSPYTSFDWRGRPLE